MGETSSKIKMGKGEAKAFIDEQIGANKVVVFSKSYCPFCKKAKKALKEVNAEFVLIELDERSDLDGDTILDVLREMTGARTVPRVFIGGKCIGGGDETKQLKESGELAKMVQN